MNKWDYKKTFVPSIQVDFATTPFYRIPYRFFAEWLNLVLEVSKVIQPDFHIAIPPKQLDWYQFPDQAVLEPDTGSSYTLRTASALLKNGDHSIHVLAQYGYDLIPGRYIVVTTDLKVGKVFSRNFMKDNRIEFEIGMEEGCLVGVEEVFNIFS